jgi:hypothetical protein
MLILRFTELRKRFANKNPCLPVSLKPGNEWADKGNSPTIAEATLQARPERISRAGFLMKPFQIKEKLCLQTSKTAF